MAVVDINEIEKLRKSARIVFNYRHLIDNINVRDFGPSIKQVISEIEKAIRGLGSFYMHEKNPAKFYCVFRQGPDEFVTVPCIFKRKHGKATIMVLSIFRKDKSWLNHICKQVKLKYSKPQQRSIT